jgi:hypothetical protein
MAMAIGGDRIDVIGAVNDNPLPGKPSIDNPMDWAYVHFQLVHEVRERCLKRGGVCTSCTHVE